ncbi:hypothetical protein RvY_18861 [Ramazzottius varieornatus]|uniref:Protein KRI1 homolog n=1 Tax=Ramazzottius varieornatus TaxID=947166 RepID=A0A1D1WB85_RAMVA|nr:hypothetical protein RvY_18861 [Ramazzottius varieornatus]
MLLSRSPFPALCFLNVFLVACKASVSSRTASQSASQEKAQVSAGMQLDNKPVAVSDELMYKSGTDERLAAAEKAFGGGHKYGSKEEELKDIYQFNTFYNPKKWQQMLEDSDYEELDQEMRKIKSARWQDNQKEEEDELDVDEEADVMSGEFDDDDDYVAMEVAAAKVQLDEQSAESVRVNKEQMAEEEEAASNDDEKSAETADKLARWMDIVAGGPDFTGQEEGDKDQKAATFDLYTMFSSHWPPKKEAVVEGETKEVDLLDMDDDRLHEENVRRKRSYQTFDDDYSSAVVFNNDGEDQDRGKWKGNDKEENRQLEDDEELIENEETFDEDDYATWDEKEKEEKRQRADIVEEEDANVQQLDDATLALDKAAKKEIDREYDDVQHKEDRHQAQPEIVHHRRKDKTRKYRTKVKDRKGRKRVKNSGLRNVRQRFEVKNADDDTSSRVDLGRRRKDQRMDAAPSHHRLGKPWHRHKHSFDQEDDGWRGQRTVALSLGHHKQPRRPYPPTRSRRRVRAHYVEPLSFIAILCAFQQRYGEERYDDDDGDDMERDDWRSRRTLRPSRASIKETKEMLAVRHRGQQRTPQGSSHVVKRRRDTWKQLGSDVEQHEFSWHDLLQYDQQLARRRHLQADDAYEMDVGDGSIASRYADVCKKVREEFREARSRGADGQAHPGITFSGAFKKGQGECDIFCERTEGANSAYVLFHLKDWPCGADKKGRCSLDGKCQETSREKHR